MSETTYVDTYWSGDRAKLTTVLGALSKDPRVKAIGPIVDISLGGKITSMALIRATEAMTPPSTDIFAEDDTVGRLAAGVFLAGPKKPTPWEWVNRLPQARQVEILAALDATQETRAYKDRLFLTQEVNVNDPITKAGLAALRDGGIITDDEFTALSA